MCRRYIWYGYAYFVTLLECNDYQLCAESLVNYLYIVLASN